MAANPDMASKQYKYINCGKKGLSHDQRKERRREISRFWYNNPNITIRQIANLYNVGIASVNNAIKNHKDDVKPMVPETDAPLLENGEDKQLYFWWINCYQLSDKCLDIIVDLLNNIKISVICEKYRLTRQRIHQIKMLAQSKGVVFPSKTKSKECVICSAMHERQAKTCSKECFKVLASEVKKINATDRDLKWSRFVYKTYTCIGCGTQFDRSNYHVSIAEAAGCSDPKYCSRQCYWDRNKLTDEDISVDKCPICHSVAEINEPTGMCSMCLNEFAQYA